MKIALDVDGVLADVIVSWLNYSNSIRPNISKNQVTDWEFWKKFDINPFDFYSELTYHQPNFQGLAYHHLATSTYPHTVPSINCSTSTGTPVFETGKVEKGLKSNQTLKSGYGTFNEWPCSVYHYKILPESQKTVKYGEIRSYCTDCSTRIKKSTWKFCPNCGTSTNN